LRMRRHRRGKHGAARREDGYTVSVRSRHVSLRI